MKARMKLPDWLIFADDATVYGLWGGALVLLSALAALMDYRRRKRSDINRVGLLPWRDIGALSGFAGLALLSFAIVGWLGG